VYKSVFSVKYLFVVVQFSSLYLDLVHDVNFSCLNI